MRFVPADIEDILTFLNSDLFIMGMGFVPHPFCDWWAGVICLSVQMSTL